MVAAIRRIARSREESIMERKPMGALLRDLQTRAAVQDWLEALVAEMETSPSYNVIRRLRVVYRKM